MKTFEAPLFGGERLDTPTIAGFAAELAVAQVAPAYYQAIEGGSVAESVAFRGTVGNPQMPPNQPNPPHDPKR